MKLNRLKKNSIVVILMSLFWQAKAQDNSYPATVVGMGQMQLSLKNGITADKWQGLTVRNSKFTFFYYWGKVNYIDSSLSATVPQVGNGFYIGAGYHTPINFLSIGLHGKSGFMFTPVFEFNAAAIGANSGTGYGIDDDLYNWTWNFSAGLGAELHIPLFTFGVTYSATYNYFQHDVLWDGATIPMYARVGLKGLSGLLFYPTFYVQVTALTGLMHTRSIDIGANEEYTQVDVEHEGTYDLLTFSNPQWIKVSTNLQASYIGLEAGVATEGAFSQKKDFTLLPHVGMVMRAGPFALDVSYAKGRLGLNAPDSTTLKNYYQGSIKYVSAGIDFVALFSGLIADAAEEKEFTKNPLWSTHFMRFIMGYRYGLATLTPVMNYPAAPNATLNSSLYSPTIYNNTTVHNFYMNLEVGSISLYCDFLGQKVYPYASDIMVGVGWQIPLIMWDKD